MEIYDFQAAVIVPVALGITEVFKRIGGSKRFAPIVSMASGIGLVALAGFNWRLAVAQGIIAGLAASGLWSGTKTVARR